MKKAFTLIEIMISVMILSVLVFALSNVLKSIYSSKKVLQNVKAKASQKELFIDTVYNDILMSDEINISKTKNPNIDTISFYTNNTLYFNIYPFVKWFVVKKDNALIREECVLKEKYCNYDLFLKGVKYFKFYKKDGKIFVYIENDKPIFFEMVTKGYGEKNETNKTIETNKTKKKP